MSSNAYFAELRPEPALRLVVQLSAVVVALTGVVVIASIEAASAWRLCGIVLWCALFGMQLRMLCRGWSGCVAFRVYADGRVAVLDRGGEWRPGRLEPDGVLLRRWGWIRLRAEAGRPFAEPLRGACRDSPEWRRLQVLWRHVGA